MTRRRISLSFEQAKTMTVQLKPRSGLTKREGGLGVRSLAWVTEREPVQALQGVFGVNAERWT